MSKHYLELTEIKQQNLELALRLERYEQQLRRMTLINEIADAANSASEPHQAVRHALTRICHSAGWPLAHAYFTRNTGDHTELVSSHIWHTLENSTYDEFIALTEKQRFRPGQGLPGIVLRDQEALWANAIRSDADRFAAGRMVGIQSAFGFPVMMGEAVVAVLEFFSVHNLAPDEILLDIVSQLGMLLGRVFERAHAAEERSELNNQLIRASRRAGMAEVASGVLHDVGNVLNSITVSSSLLLDHLEKNNINRVSKLAALLRQNQHNLAEFLSSETNGTKVITYIEQLAQQLSDEQDRFGKELNSLIDNVDHIKNVIRRQQSYATPDALKEHVNLGDIIDDALKINNLKGASHNITVQKNLVAIPDLYTDKHNLIQIINNLISNAKQALEEQTNPLIVISSSLDPKKKLVMISVTDNGCGISKENQNKIFQFGFTTKKGGHGFGLHNSANTAQAIGGQLSFISEGDGCGTTFTLTLPYKPDRSKQGEIAA